MRAPSDQLIQQAYDLAKERYAQLGVNTDTALEKLRRIAISLNCWQGDDVAGFEESDGLTGGIAVTGNYPGRARNGDELRADLEKAYSLIPGRHRLQLHGLYAETDGKKVDRNALQPEHFARWMDWAETQGIALDFNPSLFSHPLSADGFTLASADEGKRQFWIEHCIVSRHIGAAIGQRQHSPCYNNIWIPDGFKDTPVDRRAPRERLKASLDQILAVDVDKAYNVDAVESKLFGLGSEAYVVGSHEFYLGYAVANQIYLTLDAGHFHPTETISDKISAILMHVPGLMLHVSRGVRWDSDHVVTFNDDLMAIMAEIVRGDYQERVAIGLDFFDASINRIAAWVIGTRNALRGLLLALLEPRDRLRDAENAGDYTTRLALLEELKGLPFGAVWDAYCMQQEVPVGISYINDIKFYEETTLSKRG
ncbi:MAG: L-rhamnose isomerase [Anaerolineae bacterium]